VTTLTIYSDPFRHLLERGEARLFLKPGAYEVGQALKVDEVSQSSFSVTGRTVQAVVTKVEPQGAHVYVTVKQR
jgi:hypothetical protein